MDVTPGDRENDCKGLLIPINVEVNSKKGEVIVYKFQKCGAIIKNIVAKDDNRDEIYKIMENYSKGV